MNTVDVGKFIADQRKKIGLTQKQLAENLNVTDKAVSKWETGKCYPDIEIIEKLSIIFKVSINEILSGKITEPENQIYEAEKNIVDVLKASKKIKMKWRIVALVLSIIVILVSAFSVKNEFGEHQFLNITNATFDAEKMTQINIPEVGLKNVTFCQIKNNIAISEDNYGSVWLLTDNRYGNKSLAADYYLAVVLNGKIIVKDLMKWENQISYSGEFQLCDIDGNGDQEIVLQQTIGITGGAGQYLSRIFDFKNDEIVEIFSYIKDDSSRFDTGFGVTILKDKKMIIDNKFTEYNETFMLKNRSEEYYKGTWYDENGEPKDLGLMVDSFYKFEPCDVDDDGIYEIKGYQYTSLWGHADYIGTAVSVLKYNTKKSCFDVYDAYFNVE